MSATELFRSLLLVSGTNYRATSRLHRPASFLQSSEDSSFQPFYSRYFSAKLVKWL